jgi:hypothetical protein
MNPETTPTLATDPARLDVLNELISREPIFHRPKWGTTRARFEHITADFWEVGASGRRYSREDVLAELERRQQIQAVDLWEAAAFHCRELAKDVTCGPTPCCNTVSARRAVQLSDSARQRDGRSSFIRALSFRDS